MIEDRDDMPQRDGRADGNFRIRTLVIPEPRCTSHARGKCDCEDDGSHAPELFPEEEQR